MQTINLFSEYDSATLFDKIQREAAREINQWPETYFAAGHLEDYLNALKDRFYPRLPEIDLHNGIELMKEKVCLLSDLQPGAKPGVHVRVNILVYEYSFKGELYLLGCHPSQRVTESAGVCFVDRAKHVIVIEYTGFDKSPRQIINVHREYLSALTACYAALKIEFEAFEHTFSAFLGSAAESRSKEIDHRRRLLSTMQLMR
jgi:hypothetical protein